MPNRGALSSPAIRARTRRQKWCDSPRGKRGCRRLGVIAFARRRRAGVAMALVSLGASGLPALTSQILGITQCD